MKNGFTAYCLVDDGSATHIIERRRNITFQELSKNTLSDDSQILLFSGFSKLRQDGHTMFSPALQLNGDLAGFSNEQLRLFAEAERIRKTQISYNSYTIEPENRLCVVSNNNQSLNEFIDIYGGVFEIEPLLTKGSDPEFSSVTEMSISSKKSGFKIDYSVRSPVNYKKCNYCGQCGTQCPEQCISESLYFDFNACTFCRDCEKICPTQAIDIYAIEERTLEVPAILSLGDTDLQISDGSRHYYQEADITRLLSSLFPFQVDEVISCNPEICQYSSRTNAGCSECIQACSFGAISGGDKISINALKCVECGQCAGSCPTGALQYLRYDDTSFIEFFRTYPLTGCPAIVLGSDSTLHSTWWANQGKQFDNHLFLEYPKLNALSSFHLLFLLAHGASQIVLLLQADDNRPAIQKTVDNVNRLLTTLFHDSDRVLISTPTEISSLTIRPESKPLWANEYRDLNYLNRRNKLSSIFDHSLSDIADTTVLENSPDSIFHSIVCDEAACTQCLACLNECNIQALTADPSSLTLSWTGALCTGCGACVEVCPENALSTGTEIQFNHSYFIPAVAAQAEPMRCKECGKVFGTKKSFDRVMEILAKKKMDHDGHFEYCEDCRVLKLMESE